MTEPKVGSKYKYTALGMTTYEVTAVTDKSVVIKGAITEELIPRNRFAAEYREIEHEDGLPNGAEKIGTNKYLMGNRVKITFDGMGHVHVDNSDTRNPISALDLQWVLEKSKSIQQMSRTSSRYYDYY